MKDEKYNTNEKHEMDAIAAWHILYDSYDNAYHPKVLFQSFFKVKPT